MQHLKILFILAFTGFAWGDTYRTFEEVPLTSSAFYKSTRTPPNINDTTPYCYRFTWLGPRFDSTNFPPYENKTCNNIFSSAKWDTLCVNPMVVSKDGTLPDTDAMWEKYGLQVACNPRKGQVCVKYTYLRNGVVQNVTRHCAQVTVDDSNEMSHGCVQGTQNAITTEVCTCMSTPGGKPCNAATGIRSTFLSLVLSTLLLNIIYYMW